MTSLVKSSKEVAEECTIAVCGPVDAGKSSLIGVLTSGKLDDGRGMSRNRILKHKHEQDTGRTSNITLNPLFYNFKNNKKIKTKISQCTIISCYTYF